MSGNKTFYALTIDPLHVGTGGYRLGRVDNTIVRDPGTELPKVPGSSISGVCRNYTIYGLKGQDRVDAETCATHPQKKKKNNCGECIICKTFGFASGEATEAGQGHRNQIGLVKFFDARIFAFPVATMCGPVWVTTKPILENFGGAVKKDPGSESLATTSSINMPNKRLNLGWLYLNTEIDDTLALPEAIGAIPPLNEIRDRLVVAPTWLFPDIVNSNLEVRTSVAINFETGAAESGALFTYEAIPRGCLLAFDITVDHFRCSEDYPEAKILENIHSGLHLFEVMGLGGMNTRGFGRIKVVNI